MKVTPDTFSPINDQQRNKLEKVREARKFDVEKYIDIKTDLLIKYMEDAGLKACVIAISGGVDSAVVLKLVQVAQFKRPDIILTIYPVCLPAQTSKGVTNQTELLYKIDHKAVHVFDVSDTVKSIRINTYSAFYPHINEVSEWAAGQLVPYTRTPYLYYLATLLNDRGLPAIIVGTTNRDEGAYLGYVGKASDGMVDIQLISDLHKSEVYALAKELSVDSDIIEAKPTGDMFTRAADIDIFGTDYDFVEWFLTSRNTDCQAGKNLENLHKYNAHKYKAGSPAVHLDIYESGVVGGWPIQFETKYWNELAKQGDIIKPGFVAPMPFCEVPHDGNHKITKAHSIAHHIATRYPNHTYYQGLFSDNEVDGLTKLYNDSQKVEANFNGKAYQLTVNKGSDRASLYNIALANHIWNRIRPHTELLMKADRACTDWQKGDIYRVVGVNPLFRFIGYSDQGSLAQHYDWAFEDGEYKTLFSVIIYLTNNETGKTRFMGDTQGHHWNKDLTDKPIDFPVHINSLIAPKAGNCLIFPHHLLHDSEPVVNENKLIIRTDLVCKKIEY